MRSLAFVSVLLAAAIARAQAPATEFNVVPAESSITYHLVHKMHRVDGTSHKVEGKARLMPDGKAQVMIRVPSQSFDSGNVNLLFTFELARRVEARELEGEQEVHQLRQAVGAERG